MSSNTNNIDRLLAEKLGQSTPARHSSELGGHIMMAIELKARRRAALRVVCNVAVGVVVGALFLALMGVGLLLAVEYLGLGDIVAQMDGYIDGAVALLGELGRGSTFRLLTLVAVVVTAIMVLPALRTLGQATKEN